MKFTRRLFLSVASAITTTVAGCNTVTDDNDSPTNPNEPATDDITNRTGPYFNEDGELIAPIDNEVADTEELNNVRHIRPGTSLSDINTELSSPGTVVFDDGLHEVPDRIEPTANDLTVIIEGEAHIRLADSASPTIINDDQGDDKFFMIHADGLTNFTLIHRGLIEPNQSNLTVSGALGVSIWNSTDVRLRQPGGLFTNHHTAYLLVDSERIQADGLFGNDLRSGASTVVAEGLRFSQLYGVIAEGGQDGVDFNALCEENEVIGVVVNGSGGEAVDINESPDNYVEGILGVNGAEGLLNVSGDSGSRYTSRAAIGHANDNTVDGIAGTITGTGIRLVNDNPINNLSIRGMDIVSTGGKAIDCKPKEANQYDNLTLEGYAESSATSDRAIQLGYATQEFQQDGLNVDLEVTATDIGFIAVRWDGVSGYIQATGCGSDGILINCDAGTANRWQLVFYAVDNGDDGLAFSGGGDIDNGVFVGTAMENATNDLAISQASYTDNMMWGRFGTITDNGTRTLINGVGVNAGSPASGGDWNGNGRQGVVVEDENNAGDAYIFLPVAGAWSQIAT